MAALDVLAREESSGAHGQLTQVRVRVLLFVAIALDAHRHARRVTLRRRLEHFEQVAIGVNALWFDAHVFLERRQHPLLQAGHVNVQPVVVPIDLVRIPREQLPLVLAHAIEERTHIIATEDISILISERLEHLECFFRFARLLFDRIDGLLDALHDAFVAPTAPLGLGSVQE